MVATIEVPDWLLVILLVLACGAVITWGFLILSSIGSDSDTINTKVFGERICEEQGLVYSHREFIRLSDDEAGDSVAPSVKIPKIYCKKPISEEKEIIDQLVVLIK